MWWLSEKRKFISLSERKEINGNTNFNYTATSFIFNQPVSQIPSDAAGGSLKMWCESIFATGCAFHHEPGFRRSVRSFPFWPWPLERGAYSLYTAVHRYSTRSRSSSDVLSFSEPINGPARRAVTRALEPSSIYISFPFRIITQADGIRWRHS